MDRKSTIEAILKQRFFVTPTGYPSQNGFLDYGPPLAQIKLQILAEFRRIFADENTYEMEPSAVLPYEVLKNSGHIDKFCDIILTDGESIVRADHFIEELIGEIVEIPVGLNENFASILEKINSIKKNIIDSKIASKNQTANISSNNLSKNIVKDLKNLTLSKATQQFTETEVRIILNEFETISKPVSDLNMNEIDCVVALHNLHSASGLPFNPCKEFNLIFKLNDKQFLRPEIAQSQFTNFTKLLDLNNERLPFSSLAIGRSYRNEISARGGMLRTKEFEQAEIEYFSEDGRHSGFKEIRDVNLLLIPNTGVEAKRMSVGEAFDNGIISSEAVCYFLAKAQEFLLSIGFKLESLRYRQHNLNEMAHYANDCWDVEIKTMSGWIECAGIADRSTYDLTCHSKNIDPKCKKLIEPKTVYDIILNRKELGRSLKAKFKDLEAYTLSLSQEYIQKNMIDNKIKIIFENTEYIFDLASRICDCEFFIPRVIEPSFGISRILYSLVELGFNIRDERNVLSLKPKVCYLHCMITWLKYMDEFAPMIKEMKNQMKTKNIRFRTNDRNCSIGRKYSSCDEIGIPFFITFDFMSAKDESVTIRERDSTTQIRVKFSDVASILDDVITERITWSSLLEKYSAEV